MTTTTRETPTLPLPGLDGIDVVLFDLDGTLHDDPRSTDHYAASLEAALGTAGRGLRVEVEAVVARQHPALAPGGFVEPQRGLVVLAPGWVVHSATDWDGAPVAVPDDLQGRVRHDGPLRYLGDRWQVVAALATRRGAGATELDEAFGLARRLVNDVATDLARLDVLDDLLARLAPGRRLLLATNTPEALGRPLVERLALGHPFATVRYDARKPEGCLELVTQAQERWGARPEQILAVGDNLWNDLVVPAAQGCRTVHIDPLSIDPGGEVSWARYPDLASFAAALQGVARG